MNTRQRFFYEAPEAGGGAPDPAAGGGEPAGWQPTEDWGRRIDGFIEQSQPVLQQLAEVMAMPDEQQYQQQPEPQVGADGQVDIEALIAAQVEQRMGAYTPLLGQIAEREGEQIARNELEKLAGEVGEFNRDDAILLTRAYMDQGMQPQQALKQAATRAHEREAAISTAAVDAYKAQLANAAGAQPGVPATGAATELPAQLRGKSAYEAIIANFESAQSPIGASDL